MTPPAENLALGCAACSAGMIASATEVALDEKTRAALGIMRILWLALAFSLGLYVVVLWILRWRSGAMAPPHPPDPILIPVFAGVAGVVSGLSVWLPRRVLAVARMRNNSVLPAMQTSMIVGCALAEAVGLFGFVLGFLGFSMGVALPFLLAGFVLMALHYPSSGWASRQLGS